MRRAILASAAAMVAIAVGQPSWAAQSGPATWAAVEGVGDVRLNGFWNIDEAARTEATRNARAELTPAGQAIAERNRAAGQERQRRGEFVALAAATCGNIGAPFIIGTSEPWLLTVTKDMVMQTAERYQLSPRYFYTDGRTWPDLTKLPPSSSGYSIARWEGKTLVVETRGLPPGGVQGGGLKGPNTLMTERVSVDDTGDRLTWNYTFEDPELMTRPLTFSIMYDRAPPHTYSMYQICDPNLEPGRLAEAPAQEGAAQ